MPNIEVKLIVVKPKELEELVTQVVKQVLDEREHERPVRDRVDRRVKKIVLRTTREG